MSIIVNGSTTYNKVASFNHSLPMENLEKWVRKRLNQLRNWGKYNLILEEVGDLETFEMKIYRYFRHSHYFLIV